MNCNVKKAVQREQTTQAMLQFWLIICKALHDEYGFGTERLTRLYRAIEKTMGDIESYNSQQDDSNTVGFDRLIEWAVSIGIAEKKGGSVCLK